MNTFNLTKLVGFLVVLFFVGCAENKKDNAEKKLLQLLADYERQYIPVEKEYNQQSFIAASTGDQHAYEKAAGLRYTAGRFLSDKKDYEDLKEIVESGIVTDKLLFRQAQLLYYEYIKYQVDVDLWKQIVDLENKLKQKFTSFTGEVDSVSYSARELESKFKNSASSTDRQKIWITSKKKGELVAKDMIQLVKLRNKAAVKMGFDNFFEMELFVSDQNVEEIADIYNQLDLYTRGPYTQLKADIDRELAKKYGVEVESLKPWHYPDLFFQTAPVVTSLNYDSLYATADVVVVAKRFYDGLGFDVEHLIRNSSLYTHKGKSQMSVTKDIDYNGDIRISMSVGKDEKSMNVLLYEMAFGVYMKNISPELPYLLRRPSNFLTADAVAVLLSSLSTHPSWVKKSLPLSKRNLEMLEEGYHKQQRLSKFVFSRWTQVMYRFEKSLYENPEQDLNSLWWSLVQNYQLVEGEEGRDTPDWATKDHFVLMPCKYHNYILGELFASQLQQFILKSMGDENMTIDSLDLFDKKEVGDFLKEKLFRVGAQENWQGLIRNATGEDLTPDYFYNQFINL